MHCCVRARSWQAASSNAAPSAHHIERTGFCWHLSIAGLSIAGPVCGTSYQPLMVFLPFWDGWRGEAGTRLARSQMLQVPPTSRQLQDHKLPIFVPLIVSHLGTLFPLVDQPRHQHCDSNRRLEWQQKAVQQNWLCAVDRELVYIAPPMAIEVRGNSRCSRCFVRDLFSHIFLLFFFSGGWVGPGGVQKTLLIFSAPCGPNLSLWRPLATPFVPTSVKSLDFCEVIRSL